jgi:hypothetical protein
LNAIEITGGTAMKQFVVGLVAGVLFSLGYVYWNVPVPSIFLLPEMLRGNLVATAIEDKLYDLNADRSERRRALEIFFANRANFAARLDEDAGNPFLESLRKQRAAREARQLVSASTGYGKALQQPAIREALEKKYGTTDDSVLLQKMLKEELDQKPFLKEWLRREGLPMDEASISTTIDRVKEIPGGAKSQ